MLRLRLRLRALLRMRRSADFVFGIVSFRFVPERATVANPPWLSTHYSAQGGRGKTAPVTRIDTDWHEEIAAVLNPC